MINNLQNTNFGTKIVVSPYKCNKKQYFRLFGGEKYVAPSYSMQEPEAKFLRGEGISLGAVVCTIGLIKPKIIKPDSEFFLCHVLPGVPIGAMKREITKGIADAQNKLRLKASELSVFLIGAEESDPWSMATAGHFVDSFEKNGIEYSAMLGQKGKSPSSNLHYDVSPDIVTIDFVGMDGIKSFDGLNNSFDIKKLAQGDTLEFRKGD